MVTRSKFAANFLLATLVVLGILATNERRWDELWNETNPMVGGYLFDVDPPSAVDPPSLVEVGTSALLNPVVKTTQIQNMKYFILDEVEGIRHKKLPECVPSWGDGPNVQILFKTLYNRTDRTVDMQQAKLFIAGMHAMMQNPCQLRFTTDKFAESPVPHRYVKTLTAAFHDLKARKEIASDSRLYIFHSYAYDKLMNKSLEGDVFSDVSFISLDAVNGGVQPGQRGDVDITFDRNRDTYARTPYPRYNLTDCKEYTNLAFFQGRLTHRLQYGMTPPAFWQSAPGDDPLDARVRHVRKVMTDALDNEIATENKIIVRVSGHKKSTQEEYLYNLEHSTFCINMPGEGSFSHRFYVTIRYGCIPLMINGGWNLPYSQVIEWNKLSIQISEEFNFSDVQGFVREVEQLRDEKLQQYWGGDICKWHRAVWEVGRTYFELDIPDTQYGLMIDAAKVIAARMVQG